MKNYELTAEQREALQPFEEKYLRTWHEARWARPLPPSLVSLMLHIWESVTESRRGFRNGCPSCECELLNDICKLYYAKADEPKKDDAPVEAPAEAVEEVKAPAPKKALAAKKKASKAKK